MPPKRSIMITYFAGDLHLGHENIIRYCKRPFSSVREMDDALIHNWNSRVQPGDEVWFLGDFSFGAGSAANYRRRLNGTIHFIRGNHDKGSMKEPQCWASIQDVKELSVDGQRMVLCHYPMLTWLGAHRGTWMVHGHCHNNLAEDLYSKRCDVGVDGWNYTPVSFYQLKSYMDRRQFKPVDHHGTK